MHNETFAARIVTRKVVQMDIAVDPLTAIQGLHTTLATRRAIHADQHLFLEKEKVTLNFLKKINLTLLEQTRLNTVLRSG